MPVDGDALRHWSDLHDGYDLDRSSLVRGWLRGMHALAGPLAARGVPATLLTVAGIGAATAAVGVRRPAGAALVISAAVCDGLDGAVALQRRRAGRRTAAHGEAIDHAADRMTDVLFAAALWRAGASRRTAVTAAAMTVCYETARSVLRRRGRPLTIVTVGERPMRVAVVAAGLVVSPSLAARTLVGMTAGAGLQLAAAARTRDVTR